MYMLHIILVWDNLGISIQLNMLQQTIANQLLNIMVLCFMVDRDNKEIVLSPIMGPLLQFSETACVTCGTSS